MHSSLLVFVVWSWMRSLVPVAPWTGTFQETAQAIVSACDGDMRCAATLTSIAYFESSFRPDAVGDHGQSIGVWQISKAWRPGDTVQEQARTAASLVKRSFYMCAQKPMYEKLGWYASGGKTCGRPESSRIRMRLAKQLLAD